MIGAATQVGYAVIYIVGTAYAVGLIVWPIVNVTEWQFARTPKERTKYARRALLTLAWPVFGVPVLVRIGDGLARMFRDARGSDPR